VSWRQEIEMFFQVDFFVFLLDWKTHENNYYECSKYRGQPQSKSETIQSSAREALKKYLHYFERVMKIGFLIYA